jgi:hypothetical protein
MIRRALRGERLISFESDLEVTRSLPHGHVATVLGMMRALDLERIIDRTPSRMRSLTLALICQRVLRAGSKSAYARMLDDTTLAEEQVSAMNSSMAADDVERGAARIKGRDHPIPAYAIAPGRGQTRRHATA